MLVCILNKHLECVKLSVYLQPSIITYNFKQIWYYCIMLLAPMLAPVLAHNCTRACTRSILLGNQVTAVTTWVQNLGQCVGRSMSFAKNRISVSAALSSAQLDCVSTTAGAERLTTWHTPTQITMQCWRHFFTQPRKSAVSQCKFFIQEFKK